MPQGEARLAARLDGLALKGGAGDGIIGPWFPWSIPSPPERLQQFLLTLAEGLGGEARRSGRRRIRLAGLRRGRLGAANASGPTPWAWRSSSPASSSTAIPAWRPLLFAIPSRRTRPGQNRAVSRQVGRPPGGRHLPLNRLRPIARGFRRRQYRGRRSQSPRDEGADRSPAQDAAGHGRGHPGGALAPGQPTQTLRFYAANPDDLRVQVARNPRTLFALANRLGSGN